MAAVQLDVKICGDQPWLFRPTRRQIFQDVLAVKENLKIVRKKDGKYFKAI